MVKRKIFFDSILNIIAAAIPIALLQLVILPIVANKIGDEKYGIAVTLISMSTLFSLPLGNVLNNVRLLMDNKYKESNVTGDFNILLIGAIIINSIFMIIGTIYYEERISVISILLIVFFSALNLIREYLIVGFRLLINYKAILVNNVVLGLGYLIGTQFFSITGYWQCIYIVGSTVSLIYIIKHTNLIREEINTTIFFKEVTYKSIILFFSNFMKSFTTYADKLILFPLLGATSVSIYYTSTIMGKIISMAITPISGVMLSYLVKTEKISVKSFVRVLGVLISLAFGGYIFVLLVSKPILFLLYPAWANESIKLIYITTATSVIDAICVIIHPILLRFSNINWQLFINFVNLIVYTLSVYIFYTVFGLTGFCLGILVASLIKVNLMIFIFIANSVKKYKT